MSGTASTPRRPLGAPNVFGPLYSAVGRTWQATDDERKRDVDLLVAQLRRAGEVRRRARRVAGRRAAQPVRDELHQPGVAGDRGRRSRRSSGLRHPARHVPHEHRGAVDRRRDPRRRASACATCTPARTIAARRDRARAVARSRAGVPRHRVQRAVRHRVVHQQGEVDRPRRRDLAQVRRHARTRWRRTACAFLRSARCPEPRSAICRFTLPFKFVITSPRRGCYHRSGIGRARIPRRSHVQTQIRIRRLCSLVAVGRGRAPAAASRPPKPLPGPSPGRSPTRRGRSSPAPR